MDKQAERFVTEQQKKLEALISLSKAIIAALGSGDTGERLNGLIAERGNLLGTLAPLDAGVKKFLEDEKSENIPLFAKFKRTIEDVVAAESECFSLIEKEKGRISDQKVSITKGGVALKGYGGKGEAGPDAKVLSIWK